MATIDFSNTVTDSITFAKNEFGKSWKDFKDFAEHHFTQLAKDAEFLAGLKLKGILSDDEFIARFTLQKLHLQNVLLTIKGIGLVTAQNLVNGVVAIIGKTIKKSLGIVLPV